LLILLPFSFTSAAALQSVPDPHLHHTAYMIVAWVDPGDYLSVSLPCNAGDVFYGEFHLLTEGAVQFFMCDETNLALWREGGSAIRYNLVSGVRSRSWRIQVPQDGRWCGVIVSEEASQSVRVSASCNKVSPLQITGRNLFFGFEIGAFSLIGVSSVVLARRRRHLVEAPRVGLETEDDFTEPTNWLDSLRSATAITLVLQSVAIAAVVALSIAERWDSGSPYNGFNLLIAFYLFPLFIPLLCAHTLFLRRKCKGVLTLWSLPSLGLGNFFLWGWFGGGEFLLLPWALVFAVPTWLYIFFALAEAITLYRPSSEHDSEPVTVV
jgi:hypothetical protein